MISLIIFSIFSLSRSFRTLGICRVYLILPQDAWSMCRLYLLLFFRFLNFSFFELLMIIKIDVNKLVNSIIRKPTDNVSDREIHSRKGRLTFQTITSVGFTSNQEGTNFGQAYSVYQKIGRWTDIRAGKS